VSAQDNTMHAVKHVGLLPPPLAVGSLGMRLFKEALCWRLDLIKLELSFVMATLLVPMEVYVDFESM